MSDGWKGTAEHYARRAEKAEARVAELEKGIGHFLGMARKGITGSTGILAFEVLIADMSELARVHAGEPTASVSTPQSHEEIMGEPKDSANMPSKTPPSEIAQSHRKTACTSPSSPSSPSTPSSESAPSSTSTGASGAISDELEADGSDCRGCGKPDGKCLRGECGGFCCFCERDMRRPRPSDASPPCVRCGEYGGNHCWWCSTGNEGRAPRTTEPTVKHTGPCRLTCAVCEPRPDYPQKDEEGEVSETCKEHGQIRPKSLCIPCLRARVAELEARPETARVDEQARVLKLLVQRVGGRVGYTEHDLQRADRFQLRYVDNGHDITITAVEDT